MPTQQPASMEAFPSSLVTGHALGGRPPVYDMEAVVERICRELEQGNATNIVCSAPGMPSTRRLREWCGNYPAVSAAIARAREIGCEALADQCLAIADDASNDAVQDRAGNLRPNLEHIARCKLRIETRLRLLAKWSKRYSDQPASPQPRARQD